MNGLRLTNRFFLLFAGLIGVTFFVAIFPAVAVTVPFCWVALFAIVAADCVPLLRVPPLHAHFEAIRAPELGRQFPCLVQIPLEHPGFSGGVRVLAPRSELLDFSWRYIHASKEERDGKPALIAKLSAIGIKLGYEVIDSVPVMLRSSWGFWKRNLDCPLQNAFDFRVMPARETPPPQWMKEIASSIAALLGNRKVMRAGEPDLFHSMRDYQYGDSLRFIDAKRWAKLGKPVTRTFEAEKRHHVVVALDLGQSMLGTVRGCDKLDYYLGLSLVLLENALASADTASFVGFSDHMQLSIPQIRGRADLEALFRRDAKVEACSRLTEFNLLAPAIARVAPRRSIIVLLSDFTRPSQHAPILAALRQLSRKHLVVAVSLQDRAQITDQAILERDDGAATENEVAQILYSCWVDEQLTAFRTALGREGVAALAVRDDYWISAVTKLYGMLRDSSRA